MAILDNIQDLDVIAISLRTIHSPSAPEIQKVQTVY